MIVLQKEKPGAGLRFPYLTAPENPGMLFVKMIRMEMWRYRIGGVI